MFIFTMQLMLLCCTENAFINIGWFSPDITETVDVKHWTPFFAAYILLSSTFYIFSSLLMIRHQGNRNILRFPSSPWPYTQLFVVTKTCAEPHPALVIIFIIIFFLMEQMWNATIYYLEWPLSEAEHTTFWSPPPVIFIFPLMPVCPTWFDQAAVSG